VQQASWREKCQCSLSVGDVARRRKRRILCERGKHEFAYPKCLHLLKLAYKGENFVGRSRTQSLPRAAPFLSLHTTRNYLICDAFSATFSENITNAHCSAEHCDDLLNASRFYDVFLFFVTDGIEAQNSDDLFNLS
jgi:hypothetical protein